VAERKNKLGKFEQLQNIIAEREGICLSSGWLGFNTKLQFKCKQGHIWFASPRHIKRGNWCVQCALDKKRFPIEEIKKIAIAKGGSCLSTECSNLHTKLKFKCANEHIWEADANSIRRGHWCLRCAGLEKSSIKEMNKIARAQGGECLSEVYVNNRTALQFKCGMNHSWWASPSSIQQGHWCPECAGVLKGTMKKMHALAQTKEGKCLSIEYKNSSTPLNWECVKGHKWWASPNSIKQGSWCPECYVHYSEEKSKFILETFTGKKFIKNKIILEGLELDGYCKELNVAFEYQGEQHYKDVPHFHRGIKTFKKQQERDAEKRKKCKLKHITLIEIPYTKSIEDTLLVEFIYSQLRALDISIIKKPTEVTFERFKIGESKILEIEELIQSKGGKLLTRLYINSKSKLQVGCKNGHTWKISQDNLKQGNWCPECAGNKKLTITEIQQIAALRGGKCLSAVYKNSDTKVEWECKKGHVWDATPSSVIHQNNWCPDCAGNKKLTILEMQQIAVSRGGKCLSAQYLNGHTNLTWQCIEGHIWQATPANIKKGKWCRICFYNRNRKGKLIV
jgi:hypothetical protein